MGESKSARRQDPASIRATANELACAAAAVEARRDASHRPDTMAVGDAIAQLALNVTPEELAAEVLSLRSQRAALKIQTQDRRTSWRKRLLVAAFLLSVGLNVKLLTSGPDAANPVSREEVFEQSGRFNATAGGEGMVRFPQTYRAIPNLELSLSPAINKTVVTETMSWGFRWKNTGPDNLFNNSSIPWKARGPL